MTEIIQISTKGSFKVNELKKLTQCIRDIEQNDKSRHIEVFMKIIHLNRDCHSRRS